MRLAFEDHFFDSVAVRIDLAAGDGVVRTALENAFNANRTVGDTIANRVILAARARSASRAAAQQVQRKSAVSHRLNLPGKLADCSSTDPTECELFLVEGDSAGGSAKQGRDRTFQAILPLRGKVLNTEQASTAKVLTNKELSDIVSALGCGAGKEFDASKLRYHKICLLMDADSDGNHICTLLLTFFYRHLPELIRQGYVYIAQPPLYRIDAGKQVQWARDDAERERILKGLNGRRDRVQVQRFKGLGEMNPATLKETTLDPARWALLRVGIADPGGGALGAGYRHLDLAVQAAALASLRQLDPGFVTTGKPTIYVQSADGKVLHRQDDYDGGAPERSGIEGLSA